MSVFPFSPTPSMISAPIYVDEMHQFITDSSTPIRRAKHSRPRRRYQIEWLGRTTVEMRTIRGFLVQQRLGALSFEWLHLLSLESATYASTTPIIVTLPHMYLTGQWVGLNYATNAALNLLWQVTRISATQFSLNGSTASGAGTAYVFAYLPQVYALFADDTFDAPVQLIGPDSADATYRQWNWSIQIEELLS